VLNTLWAVVRGGKIELVESAQLPEGARALVTLLPQEDESSFWMGASQTALADVWDNTQDDVYAQWINP
jgi:hypothetical protein